MAVADPGKGSDQVIAALDNNKYALDGSYDVYFGPEKPIANVNWVQTIPNKGCYGPTKGYINKTWVLNDFELEQSSINKNFI